MSHDLNLQANERFRSVAMERALDWYEIAKMHYGENLTNRSLYLITGFYKSRSWSLASFSDATAAEHRRIRVIPWEGEGTTVGRDWKCTFPVRYRDGPGPSHNGNVNQSVFISGFKITVREEGLGWLSPKLDVQPVPVVHPRQGYYFCTWFLWLFCKRITSRRRCKADGSVDVSHVPMLSQVGIIVS